MRRWLVRPVVALGLAAALLLGAGIAVSGTGSDSSRGAVPVVPVDVAAVAASGDLSATAEALEARLRSLPGDWQSWTSLGAVHLQRAVATADPGYYDRSEAAFERSLEVRSEGNDGALTGLAALAASRHDFTRARELADRAIALNPYSASAHGVLTDALVELGADDAALTALQRMLDLRPGVPSYTRASYAYELRGDLDQARTALETALRVAAVPDDVAFARRYLGELAFGQGDLDGAAQQFEAGLREVPGSPPLLAGRARVESARGELDAALRDWHDVVERLPLPGYLTELGDLYASAGRAAEAKQQYDVVRATERLFLAAGADLDVEQALFAADHGEPARALEAAERAWRDRQSVHVADAYAWALHANGRDREARALAASAQRLGTRNALFDYHRGMIELALGEDHEARRSLSAALALNPHFSPLLGPRARAALDGLGGPV